MRLATQKELAERKLNEIRDKLAYKYGDERGGTQFTKQGSYACIDFQRGFDKGAEEMATFKDEQIEGLVKALSGILEIGKRDMSNPKYDGYFETATEALENFRSAAEGSASFRKEGSNDPEVK